jgi:hypothetical protein
MRLDCTRRRAPGTTRFSFRLLATLSTAVRLTPASDEIQ